MLKKDLADGLGISTTMVRKCARRGMPTDSVDAARLWRSRHLESIRTKAFRADGNIGRRRAGRIEPQTDDSDPLDRPGASEAAMFDSAVLFAERHGLERFGPLLVHLATVMSDSGHAASQLGAETRPVWDEYDTLQDAYERLLAGLAIMTQRLAMSDLALDLCTAALESDATTVEALYESAELLPVLLATLVLRLSHPDRPAQDPDDLAAALGRQWKDFGAADVLEWAEGGRSDQCALLARLRSACRCAPGADLTPQRLGILFGSLATESGPLVRVGERRGSGRWSVRGSGG